MNVAIAMWQADWLQNECRTEAFDEAAQKGTRNEARQYLRSVFETHVRCKYGGYNLANASLKYPGVDIPAIVRAYTDYSRSPGYEDRVR